MTKTSDTRIDHPRGKDARAARRAVKYQHWVDRTTRPLDILALIFLIDFLLGRVAPDGPEWWQPGLGVVSFLIWFAFAVDYLVRLSLSPARSTFFMTHKLDLLMVLLPMLRMLRVVLLLRKSFKSIPTDKIAGSLFSIVIGVVALGAVLEWQVEHNAPGANITTVGTAFWWAITTTTTVGYGDTYPVTTAGRVIASCVMVVGIGLIGTVSATVAAWFVSHNQKLAERSRAAAADQAAAEPVAGEPAAGEPVAGDPVAGEPAAVVPPAADSRGEPAPAHPAGNGTGARGAPVLVAAVPPVTTDLSTTLAALSAQLEALSFQQADLQAAIDRLAALPPGR